MIFLGDLEKVNDDKYLVRFIHYMPFHTMHGMKDEHGNLMTQEQLEEKGFLVEELPEPIFSPDKPIGMFINPKTKEIYYEDIITDSSEPQSEGAGEINE